MLRDEAIETLLGRLEREPYGSLSIYVDRGDYEATFSAETTGVVEGETKPVLSDALVSLIEALRERRTL